MTSLLLCLCDIFVVVFVVVSCVTSLLSHLCDIFLVLINFFICQSHSVAHLISVWGERDLSTVLLHSVT